MVASFPAWVTEMCCEHCCPARRGIEVGDRVHSTDVFEGRVRVNGVLTIKVKYLSPYCAVVSIADRPLSGDKFYIEKCMPREEFDGAYELCNCPSTRCEVG